MNKLVWSQLAALAVAFSFGACGGRAAPEPAAPERAQEEEEQASTEDATSTGPDPSGETVEQVEQVPPDPAQVKAELLAAEKAAFERAEPIFKQHCTECHVKGGKKAKAKTLDHFDMTTYPFGGHHADEISAEVRKVLAIGGGKPTMPMDHPGAVQGNELSLIAAWADAYDKAHAGGAHEDRGHDAAHDQGSAHKH